jgi:hypothetical protein
MTLRVLQNNGCSFPLIFTITVVELMFLSRSRIFYSYGEVTIAGEGLKI